MKRLAILLACLAGLGIFLGLGATGSHAATRSSGGDPTLTLVVHVVNGGADITPADFTLMASSPVFSFAGAGGSANVTEIAVPDATYQLSVSGPGGGTPSVWSCLGVSTFTTNSVTLTDGDIATCSITDTFPPVTTTTTAAPTTTTTVPATTTTAPGETTTTTPGATTTTPTTAPAVPPTVPGVTPTPTVPGQTTPGCPECVVTGTTPTGVAATGVPEAPTAPIQSVQPVTG